MDSEDDMHDANDVDSLEDFYSGDTAADSDDDNDADYDFDNDSDDDADAIMLHRHQVWSIPDWSCGLCFFYSCLALEEKVVGFSRKAEFFFFVYLFV